MVTSSLLSVQLVVVAYKEVMEVLVRCWSDGDVVLVLPWGRTPRLDSGVRWAKVGPLSGKDPLIIVTCGYGFALRTSSDLRKCPPEALHPSCCLRIVANERQATQVLRNSITRDRAGAHERLVAAYFTDSPMYNEKRFRQTFRMARPLFNQIVNAVTTHSAYFQYENIKISERSSRMALDHFCQAVMEIYGPEFLRKPTVTDVEKTFIEPADDDHKRILYKQKQESARKDVERAFGVLKKKWTILANPARALRKDRIQEFSDLSSFLNSVVLSTSNDRWYFSLSSSGEFSVKDTRLAIDDLVLPSHSEPTRWVKLIPIKINVFMWRARRGCLPTRYNLVQKGVILESTSCPVCFSDEEDVHHLLFRCSLSQEVLHRVCRWWEIDFQLWRSFSEWDEWFSSIRLPGSVKGFLEGVFYVAWWFIWGFRNRSTFDVNKPSRSIIFENIVSSSFLWCNSRCSRKFSRDDWLKNPHLISL
ncbi:RNA-directed DNA polymerase, eukaryota [Tanacetum coccineum]